LNSVANACLHQTLQGKHQTFPSHKNFANTESQKGIGAKQHRVGGLSHTKIAATDLPPDLAKIRAVKPGSR
jgi:hypothetical protein